MRIAGWHVDGYGHFADLEAHDLPDGLVVLHGPNEAGKTTLVDFLTGMMFGFPSGSTTQPKHAPLNGGQHGGRLWLADATDTWLVARTPKKLTVRRASDDEALSRAQLEALLGGATRALFQAVFSVNVDDLRQLAALEDQQLNDLVFSAGIVGAGRSATSAINTLEARRQALYRPKGRPEKYPILSLRAELRDAEDRLGAAQRAAAQVPQLRRALAAAEARAEQLREGLVEADAEQRELDGLIELWPASVEAREAAGRLAELAPGVEVHAGVATRLESLESAVAAASRERAESAETLRSAEADAAGLAPEAAALAVADAVDSLRAQSPIVAEGRAQAAELRLRADTAAGRIDSILAELGRDLDPGLLGEDARRPPTSDEVEAQAEPLRTANAAAESARARLAQLSAEQVERDRRIQARRAELAAAGSADVASIDARLAALEVVARMVGDAEAAAAPVTRARRGSGRSLRSLALLAGLAGVGAGTMLLAGATAAGLLLAVLAVSATCLAAFLARVAPAAPAAVREPARVTQRPPGRPATRADVAAAAALLDTEPLDELAVREQLDLARAERDRRLDRASQAAALEREAGDQAFEEATRLATAGSAQRAAESAAVSARSAWSAWLVMHGLPGGLTPAGAARYCEALRFARQLSAEVSHATEAALPLEHRAAEFDREVAAVAGQLGVDAVAPEATLELLSARVTGARQVAGARRDAERLVSNRATALELAETRCAAAGEAIAELLTDAGVRTADELRAAARRTDERSRLADVVEGFDRALALAAGVAGSAAMRAALADARPEDWAARRSSLAAYRAESEEQRDELLKETGHVGDRLAELESSDDVAGLVLEVAGIRADLRARLREYTVAGLAQGLLSETLARYQRERQPRVLARAEALFAKVTEGRYPRLRTDDRVVVATDAAGRDVAADALSRGAKEQLYLCLRFALAESFSERAPLPILLDDVLVNFDPARARQVAGVIAAVARERQVLAFTCHPWVRDLLVAASPAATEIPFDCATGALVPIRHGGSAPAAPATA